MAKKYTNLKKREHKNGEIEFEAEIPVETLELGMQDAVADAAQDLTLPGFRKGKVPEHIAREHVGEMRLLEMAADEALHEAIREIATDEKISIIGKPQLIITKIAPKNPLEFKVRFAIAPEISLPDYKKIARTVMERKDPVEVTDKEMEEAIERLRNLMSGQMPGEEKSVATPLPEINDEFVKKLGPFQNVEEFRTGLKKQLMQEKEMNAKQLKRDEIVKAIVDKAKLSVPQMLITQELADFMDERDAELQRAGLSIEEYLKQIGKTAEALEKEERALLENQIKTSMVFGEIRKKEDIKPSEREIQINMARLKQRYPGQSEHELRQAAEAIATQEKLYAILEGKEEK